MRRDYPHIGADRRCPFCGGLKSIGLLTCDPCWRLNHADGDFDAVLQQREGELKFIDERDNREPSAAEARETHRAAEAVARWKGLA